MINLKRKGNALLNADVIKPDMRYATFEDGIADDVKDEITLAAQYGAQMLREYGVLRDNMHIKNIMDFVDRAESIWQNWDEARSVAKRGKWWRE